MRYPITENFFKYMPVYFLIWQEIVNLTGDDETAISSAKRARFFMLLTNLAYFSRFTIFWLRNVIGEMPD